MCGRFVRRASAAVIAEAFGPRDVPTMEPHHSTAPSQSVAVVRQNLEKHRRELAFLHWGLIPSWADDPAIGNTISSSTWLWKSLNARRIRIGKQANRHGSRLPGATRRERRRAGRSKGVHAEHPRTLRLPSHCFPPRFRCECVWISAPCVKLLAQQFQRGPVC
jgi:hypothetical protein